jgi:hypothetical protein
VASAVGDAKSVSKDTREEDTVVEPRWTSEGWLRKRLQEVHPDRVRG